LKYLRTSAGIPEVATVRGAMFQKFANKVLGGCGNWKVRNLQTQTVKSLQVNNTQTFVINRLMDFTSFQEGIYYVPKAQNFSGIDSLTKIGDDLVMFQITVALQHPIKHAALQKHLASLGIDKSQNKSKNLFCCPS